MEVHTEMQDERLEYKGGLLRGYAKWLRENKHFDAVSSAASPEVRARLADPPLATEWVSAAMQNGVLAAVHAVGRDELIHSMVRGSIGGGVLRLIEPLIHGVVRVFGRTPAAVLSRLETIRPNVMRGVRFEYEPLGPNSGIVHCRAVSEPFGEHAGTAWRASIESLCELLGFRGATVTVASSADRREERITVRW
ncbi:MAG: hypothetical protein JNK05_33745 [Myxococcales bacterium]|nr:hypothetical protein [Myxococcales bacterium]